MWERLLVTAEEEELPGRCVLRGDPNEGTICWETFCKLEGMDVCECVRKGKEENVNEKRCKSKIVHEKHPGKMQHQNVTNEFKFCGN